MRSITQDPKMYFKMAPGEHVWPFRIELPNELPPSVSHPSGACRIVYEVRAAMSNPGDRDGKAFAQFTLISLPRNREPRIVEQVGEKAYGLHRKEVEIILHMFLYTNTQKKLLFNYFYCY